MRHALDRHPGTEFQRVTQPRDDRRRPPALWAAGTLCLLVKLLSGGGAWLDLRVQTVLAPLLRHQNSYKPLKIVGSANFSKNLGRPSKLRTREVVKDTQAIESVKSFV